MKHTCFFYRAVLGNVLAIALVVTTGEKAVSQAANPPGSVATSGEATPNDLRAPVRKTAEELVAAIQQGALWQYMTHFQTIADQNPGADGHGNRDTGTSGYRASVNYVANLMRRAGYSVTIQTYNYRASQVVGTPTLGVSGRNYPVEQDWVTARLTSGGDITARVRPVAGTATGCSAEEFADFRRGDIAILRHGDCVYDAQVENAEHAGASAIILYDLPSQPEARSKEDRAIQGSWMEQPRLHRQAKIPVIAVASSRLAADLLAPFSTGESPTAHLQVRTEPMSGADYNVIAESPYGDPSHVVVVDAHLDSIFGAGMLDNASGSSTILGIALQMSGTSTVNRLRYIWFGGEELGLLGSAYYTNHLTQAERDLIDFDIDADVTATPNYDYEIADPAYAYNVHQFPPNVVPDSQIGNQFYADFFNSVGVPSLPAPFGNYGTDSNSFALIGIPNTGILTRQDCCKGSSEVALWGGFLGNYEGNIPSYDGGCVDRPNLWCDNLSNNDPAVLALASRATAYVVFQLANHTFAAGK